MDKEERRWEMGTELMPSLTQMQTPDPVNRKSIYQSDPDLSTSTLHYLILLNTERPASSSIMYGQRFYKGLDISSRVLTLLRR